MFTERCELKERRESAREQTTTGNNAKSTRKKVRCLPETFVRLASAFAIP